jgi:hypothetical protein
LVRQNNSIPFSLALGVNKKLTKAGVLEPLPWFFIVMKDVDVVTKSSGCIVTIYPKTSRSE